MAVCQAAMGSVLFVDEAYQLAAHEDAGSSRDFGQEALGALIAEMENHRDRFIVILAGYREEMESLYRLNPGLRDRIPHMLHFPHYTREELLALYLGMIAKKGVSDEARAARVKQYLHTLPDAFLSSREFGNARFVRNLVERTVIKALMRTQLIPRHTPLCLCVSDFEQVLAEEDLQSLNRDRIRQPIGF
jgi:stage V sporulation protein K